ncbi:hypothetical protein ACFL5X_03955, partial [Candidatus Omnitrophota bacterium]
MKAKLETLKAILIVILILLICFIVLGRVNNSIKRKVDEYAAQLKESVSQKAIDALKEDNARLEAKLAGLRGLFALSVEEDSPVVDGAIIFAQKLDAIRKRLQIKTELQGAPAAVIEVPSKLPSKEKAAFFIGQIEELEKAVDLGLRAGLDFTRVKIPAAKVVARKAAQAAQTGEEESERSEVELRFIGQGPEVAQYILLITEFVPLLSVEQFASRNDVALSYDLKLSKLTLDPAALELVSADREPFDYRSTISVDMALKEAFLNNSVFKVAEEPQATQATAKV